MCCCNLLSLLDADLAVGLLQVYMYTLSARTGWPHVLHKPCRASELLFAPSIQAGLCLSSPLSEATCGPVIAQAEDQLASRLPRPPFLVSVTFRQNHIILATLSLTTKVGTHGWLPQNSSLSALTDEVHQSALISVLIVLVWDMTPFHSSLVNAAASAGHFMLECTTPNMKKQHVARHDVLTRMHIHTFTRGNHGIHYLNADVGTPVKHKDLQVQSTRVQNFVLSDSHLPQEGLSADACRSFLTALQVKKSSKMGPRMLVVEMTVEMTERQQQNYLLHDISVE